MTTAPEPRPSARDDDTALLAAAVRITTQAGDAVLALFDRGARPGDAASLRDALSRNERATGDQLRNQLQQLRPAASWADDDQDRDALRSGEWWVVDSVEGNVNHVHGLPDWAVSVALLREGAPVLAVVRQPIADLTYTAAAGQGAHLNGEPLHASGKTDLSVALVSTGQAEAGQRATYRRIGDSITAMLHHALLVSATVPSTFPLLRVAAGHADAFWQYATSLSGVVAGALLVQEAGGVVSDVGGGPWSPVSADLVASAPGLHGAVIDALAVVA